MDMTLHEEIRGIGEAAREAAHLLGCASARLRNHALLAMADAIDAERGQIISANEKDLAAARVAGLSPAMIDRLTLNSLRVDSIVKGLREVVDLPDPLARRLSRVTRPNGLVIDKVPVPIGVIAIIYESRPNVYPTVYINRWA